MSQQTVTIEFLGLARHRAGRSELIADGRTLGDLLRFVDEACPGLRGLLTSSGTVSREYLLSMNGERFVEDLCESIPNGSRLLILGADAGG